MWEMLEELRKKSRNKNTKLAQTHTSEISRVWNESWNGWAKTGRKGNSNNLANMQQMYINMCKWKRCDRIFVKFNYPIQGLSLKSWKGCEKFKLCVHCPEVDKYKWVKWGRTPLTRLYGKIMEIYASEGKAHALRKMQMLITSGRQN